MEACDCMQCDARMRCTPNFGLEITPQRLIELQGLEEMVKIPVCKRENLAGTAERALPCELEFKALDDILHLLGTRLFIGQRCRTPLVKAFGRIDGNEI